MNRILFLFIFALATNALTAQTTFKAQTGGHCFTMEVPDYMSKTYDLNEVADLQYFNADKPAYVIVIHDFKDQLESLDMVFEGPKSFLEDFLEYYQNDAEERSLGAITEFYTDHAKFAQVELTWRMEEEYLFMLITTVETAGHFYKILAWTSKDQAGNLVPDFQKMIRTIKE